MKYKSLQSLKRAHTDLHRAIEAMEKSSKITEKQKADIARIIAQLANSLASL